MWKFAEVARKDSNDARQALPGQGRAATMSGHSSTNGLHRDLGNQAIQRLYGHRLSMPKNQQAVGIDDSPLTSTLSATLGSGEPLRDPTRTFMETALGTRLDQVRVHTGQQAEIMSQTLGAEAFTYGRNIYFNADRYAPDTARGRKLLTHELVHTIQQGFHDQPISGDVPVSRPEDSSEQQAERVSEGIAENRSVERDRPVPTMTLNTYRIQPTIQMATGLDVAVYETKDHGEGWEDAPSETYKMEANSLKEAGSKLNKFIGAARGLMSDASISQLSFYGHGAPGSQSVGAGEDWDSTKEISVASIGAFPDDYKQIYAPLADGASVYLRGCNVGAEEKGLKLLQEVKSSCKTLAGKNVEAYGWTGQSYHMRKLWYDWYEQTGERASSSEKEPKMTWEKLKERTKGKKK